MNLVLTRPLISLDLEATGTDVERDRIVEIGTTILAPSGAVMTKSRLVDPTIPIPSGISSIHGITDEKVKNAPTFAALSKSLSTLLHDCDITGYNVAHFDIPLLSAEFKRCGITWPNSDIRVVDAYSIIQVQERRTLEWALHYYANRILEDAHTAAADSAAALDVLIAQSDKYSVTSIEGLALLQRDPDWVDSTGKFGYLPDKSIVVRFGKHSGTPLSIIKLEYLHWMLKADFPVDAKDIVYKELDRRSANG